MSQLLTRKALLTKLREEDEIYVSEYALQAYCRGWRCPMKGVKVYLPFYPDVLPHRKAPGGMNLYIYEEVIEWLKKYRGNLYWRNS